MLKRKYVLNIDKGDVIRSRSLQGLFVLEDRMSSYFPSFLFTNVRTDRIFQVARPFAQSQLPSAKRKILSNRNDRIFNDAITMVVRKIRLVSLRCRKKNVVWKYSEVFRVPISYFERAKGERQNSFLEKTVYQPFMSLIL